MMMTSPLFLLILKALVTFFKDIFVYISQFFGPCLHVFAAMRIMVSFVIP
uniref:Uncharacterized protein n=1 Tax=Arundo donax TaxID=35708 RepID=A0A0A9CMB6_ARUDO